MKDKIELKTNHMLGYGFCNIAWVETPQAGKYRLVLYYSSASSYDAGDKLDRDYPELALLGRFCLKPNMEKEGLSIGKKDPFWQDLDSRADVCKMVISGRRKIAKIIDKICQDADYSGKENEKAKQKLMKFRNSLPAKEYKKPKKHKTLANYQGSLERMPETKAKHTVVRLLNKRGEFEVYKQDDNGREVIDLEVFSSVCANILVDESPKVRAVYDDETGERTGTLSREIEHFRPLADLRYEDIGQTVAELVNAGLGRYLAVNYILQNNDGHEGNYGYVDGKIYIIDFDRATWPLAAEYLGFFDKDDVDVFPVTTRDIDSFPLLQDAKPYHFLNATANSEYQRGNVLYAYYRMRAFEENRQLRDDAYFIFLKRLLLDEQVFRNIANEVFTKQSLIEQVVTLEVERTEALKQALLASKKFLGFMITAPDLKARLMQEFSNYNAHFCKKEDSRLRIDIDHMEANWKTIDQLFHEQVKRYCIAELKYDPSRVMGKMERIVNINKIKENLDIKFEEATVFFDNLNNRFFAEEAYEVKTNPDNQQADDSLVGENINVEKCERGADPLTYHYQDNPDILAEEIDDQPDIPPQPEVLAAEDKIEKIKQIILTLDKKVYSFAGIFLGGEKYYYGNQQLLLAKGVKEILDICQQYEYDTEDELTAERALALITQIAQTAQSRTYFFFNPRDPLIAQFYKTIIAMSSEDMSELESGI